MPISFLLKDPDAALDYELDWGADYLVDGVLVDSIWSVTPDESGGLNVIAHDHDATRATVSVGGGNCRRGRW